MQYLAISDDGYPALVIEDFRCERREEIPSVEWILWYKTPVERVELGNGVYVAGQQRCLRFKHLAIVNNVSVFMNKEEKIKLHFELVQ
jgi:hypothetical protein